MGEAQLMLNPGFLGSVAYVALVQTNPLQTVVLVYICYSVAFIPNAHRARCSVFTTVDGPGHLCLLIFITIRLTEMRLYDEFPV